MPIRWIQRLKYHDFVPCRHQSRQVPLETVQRREQIGQQDDQSPFARELGDTAQRLAQVGRAALRRVFERQHHLPQMPVAMARGQIISHTFVKRNQPHGVALSVQKPPRVAASVRTYSDLEYVSDP